MSKYELIIYILLYCIGDTRGRANALADLGRSHLAMGACGSAVSYLRQALAATEGLSDTDEEVMLSIFSQFRLSKLKRYISI